jgi:hypothetical protein
MNICKGCTAFGTLVLLAAGCSRSALDNVTKQILNVEMYAALEIPVGATGSSYPDWQRYTLTSVAFLNSDDDEALVLFDGSTPQTFRIIDREQIIYSREISDYKGESYRGLVITFDPTIVGSSGGKDDYSCTLADPVLVKLQDFTIEEGKGMTIKIKTKWRNTISAEGMTPPEYDISIKI